MPSREATATVVIVVAAVGILAGTTLGPSLTGGTGGPTATGGATSTIVYVSGEIHLATDEPAGGDTVFLSDEDAGAVQSVAVTNGTGHFDAPVGSGTTVDLQYYQARRVADCCAAGAFPRDGSPDFYPLTRVVPDSNTSVGRITLPPAYPLNVTVRDESGAPIENASVHVRYPETEDGADGGISGTTDATGRLAMAGASQPGIEVTGAVEVRVERGEEVLESQTVTVTEAESVSLTVQRAP